MTTYLATIRIEASGLAEAKEIAAYLANRPNLLGSPAVISVEQEEESQWIGVDRCPSLDVNRDRMWRCQLRAGHPPPCRMVAESYGDEFRPVPPEQRRTSTEILQEFSDIFQGREDHPLPSEPLPHGVSVCSPAVTEAIEAAIGGLRKEMRQEVANVVRMHIDKSHVQGGWTP